VVAVVALGLLVGTGCGDDDDASDGGSPTTEPTTEATEATDPTDAAGPAEAISAEAEAFCQAVLDAEEATLTEDPAQIGPAIEAAVEAAPDDLRPAVETVRSEVEAGNPGSPAFTDAYLELTEFAKSDCGFTEVATTAGEYSFTGLPDELDAGPTVFELDNQGAEIHQLMLIRVTDDAADLTDVATMTEDELMGAGTVAGGAFAGPGETGSGMVDLEAGRYVAACFLPTGATPENMPAIESGQHQGAAHYTEGMVQVLTVT
jgi:hypothetical protein